MLQEVCVHDYLAVRLCGEMLRDPTAPEVRLYAKTLSNLELSREETVRKDLQTLLQQLVQVTCNPGDPHRPVWRRSSCSSRCDARL